MPVFSFSAPAVTEEDEKREQETLNAEERERILSDVYGDSGHSTSSHEKEGQEEVTVSSSSANNNNNPAAQQPEQIDDKENDFADKVPALQNAILALPDEDKAAYVKALELAPSLIAQETNWIDFLRAEKGQLTQAAQRLAQHWKLRQVVFGPQRAFLPMTLNGAMAADMNLLQLGLFYILPRADKSGRPVMFWDRTRFTSRVATRQAMWAVLWYGLANIGKLASGKKNGYVMVVNGRHFDLYRHFDRPFVKTAIQFLYTFPWEMKGMHFIYGSGSAVLEVVLPVVKFILGQHIRQRFQIHKGSDLEVVRYMEPFGLQEEHVLPAFRGDLYNQQQCKIYLNAQRRLEEEHQRLPIDNDNNDDDDNNNASEETKLSSHQN